jgi:hypothetical protein
MSLALALLINVAAMLALIGGLAFAMSRAVLLTPHEGSEPDNGGSVTPRSDYPVQLTTRTQRARRLTSRETATMRRGRASAMAVTHPGQAELGNRTDPGSVDG